MYIRLVPTKLEGLTIEEVSGVDSPANQLEGWIVQKAKDGDVKDIETGLATLYASLANTADLFDGAPADLVKARESLEKSIEVLLAEEETKPKESLVDKVRRFATTRKAQRSGKSPTGVDEDEPEGAPEVEPDEDDLPAKGGTVQPAVRGSIPGTVRKEDLREVVKEILAEEDITKSVEEDGDALREAIVKALDRIENIEKALTGSASPEGQETEVEKGAGNTLDAAIIRAAHGERVTVT